VTESEEARIRILVTYQWWCSERVVAMERAMSIINEAEGILRTSASKAQAGQRFIDAGWADQQCRAKVLVNALWPFRQALIDAAIAGYK
jgi:hypothetical protein